jgi:phage terminase large subunit-like protein
MNREDKIELIKLLEEQKRRKEDNFLWDFEPYDWQKEFYYSGVEYKQRMLMAANRVGKTFSSCIELAYHLTGRYPEWWEGIRFEHPTNCWALGVSGEQIRDVLQSELFGVLTREDFTGGLIPKKLIGEITRSMTPKLAKDVKVKHVTGGYSQLSLKSYSQGQHALMGSSVDYALIDEEPEDEEIYPQVLTRTATGNRGAGGYVVLSFTPENGVTRLVDQFTNDIQPGQFLKNVTWDDAPHLDDETKEQLLSAIPEYQRDMRTKGLPLLGSGVIFPVNENNLKVELTKIPDHWPRVCGMDFGYDHPAAMVWMAWDRENDVVYIYNCVRIRQETIPIIASIIRKMKDWIPVAWPHDGLQHDRKSGVQIAELFRQEGVNMMDERATFEDGSNGVEAGLMMMLDRMKTGRLKVNDAPALSHWFEEFRMYHRKDGKIVKERDDLMDATRYGLMMLRNAETELDSQDFYDDVDYSSSDALGY